MVRYVSVLNVDYCLIQKFLRTRINREIKPSFIIGEVIQDHNISTVATLSDRRLMVKLIRARTWHEHFKVFLGKSRTHTEYFGALKLQSIGINTPEIFEMGISIIGKKPAPYIGYYIMENLVEKGFRPASSISIKDDRTTFNVIVDEILNAVMTMTKEKLLYADLHLGNIFYCPKTLNIYFIDPGVKKYINKYKFKKRLTKTLIRFQKLLQDSGLENDHQSEKKIHNIINIGS